MPHAELQLLSHPYDRLSELQPHRDALRDAARIPGSAVLWTLDSGRYAETRRLLERRPGGLALIVLLPDADRIEDDPNLLHAVQRCRPHGLLPRHEGVQASDIAEALRRPPLDLPVEVTDYLAWRGLKVDRDTTRLLRRILELSSELRSVSALSRSLYLSRRALGRRLMTRGLPVPSHWLQFGRLLRLSTTLQNSEANIASIAYDFGYPDGFSLSNQMQRLIGLRPSQVRECLGWEWILETWLRREADEGGLAPSGAREIRQGERAYPGKPASIPRPRRGRHKKKSKV
ncbi:MAG: AraC family transcriptional regulator [Longimicrobiales bacterium]|nr:AraC family transcriptional regulator [Longimicrobiales bacterium]